MGTTAQRDIPAIHALQLEQQKYGTYALIPNTNQTYEDAIQELVAQDLLAQWLTFRQTRQQRQAQQTIN
jgi:hypothetical protein